MMDTSIIVAKNSSLSLLRARVAFCVQGSVDEALRHIQQSGVMTSPLSIFPLTLRHGLEQISEFVGSLFSDLLQRMSGNRQRLEALGSLVDSFLRTLEEARESALVGEATVAGFNALSQAYQQG